MIIEKNAEIPMSDGGLLRANVYRPEAPGRYPVVMAFGIYGKDVHFEDAYNPQWKNLRVLYPELCSNGSTGRHLRWEITDPERWVPDGYTIIAVDARGSGQSPGYLDIYSPRETRDYYECIEWAGVQPWSNGKVGLLGISYLAVKQWQVAALRPPHLAAIVPWEGASDCYRDSTRQGGIWANSFRKAWWPRQALVNQHGNGATTHRDRDTDQATTGEPLSPALLDGNRADSPAESARRVLDDAWFRDRSARLDRIEVPLLSAANIGGPGNHLRGNVEGFLNAGSREKWLFGHIGTHYESFYLPRYVALQKRFFDHYLKGLDNGWEKEPPVQMAIRHVDGSATLHRDTAWPLPATQWTPYHLDAAAKALSVSPVAAESSLTYEGLGEGVDFVLPAFTEATTFAGPAALRLWVSSSTADMDVFVVLRAFDPTGNEAIFTGAHERVRVAMGWLRASHRKQDAAKSRAWRPYHTHDELQPLTPGEVYPLDVEIWPTTIVYPAGWRLVLTVRGCDLEVVQPGRMLHDDPVDRDPAVFGGHNTLHTGGRYGACLLMPLLPAP
ncbi:MAG: CocE/NonD family hydrolase [Pseudomonadota bacterium]